MAWMVSSRFVGQISLPLEGDLLDESTRVKGLVQLGLVALALGLVFLLATWVWTCGSSGLMVAPGLGTWFATWLWSCCPSRLMVTPRLGTLLVTRLWTC